MPQIAAGDIKYFESGYLGLSTSLTGTSVILGLQDVTISYSVDVQEVQTFDTNFSKLQIPTYKSWTVSCSGIFLSLSGDTYHPQSGNSYVVNGQSAKALLQNAKTRSTSNKVRFKYPDNSYESGNVIITSFEMSASAGESLTFSLEMVGSGDLNYSAT